MQRDNALSLIAAAILLGLGVLGIYWWNADTKFTLFVGSVAIFAWLLMCAAAIFDEHQKRKWANRPAVPCFELQVDNIIKRLDIDMEVFRNIDREFFYVENLRHLTMADLDKIDLRRSVKCRLLECLHALVFHYPISAQLTQPDVFSV